MRQTKKDTIINPIFTKLTSCYQMTYYQSVPTNSFENLVLNELNQLKKMLTLEESLFFAHTFFYLNIDIGNKENSLKRKFMYVHLTFLFPKKIIYYQKWLLGFVCDAITEENVKNHLYLTLLSDSKWVQKVFEHAMLVDYSSSLTNSYEMDNERLKRIFLFLCRRIEENLKVQKESEITLLKKEILKSVKTYQTSQLYKRSGIS